MKFKLGDVTSDDALKNAAIRIALLCYRDVQAERIIRQLDADGGLSREMLIKGASFELYYDPSTSIKWFEKALEMDLNYRARLNIKIEAIERKKRKTRSTDDLYMSDSENAQKLRSEIEPKLNMPAESLPLRLYQCPTEPQQIPTTHTFSAELIDGRVVEMPAPGDDWTESKREEFKRGDLRVRNLDYVKYNSPEPGEENYQIPTFDKYDDWDFFNITSEGACWAREMLRPNEPILSITTWIREISIEPPEEDPHPFREPSESNFIGLQIWPGHQDQKKHDIWNAFPHKHREPSSFNTWCLKSWPERDDEVE